MLQAKNSLVNTLIGGTALDVIAKTSMTSANCINCLSPIFVTSTGSNNISSDASAATLGIGTQDALLNTYFTDPANNDYTINTVGQAAFLGQGWNGTDLVSWAYAVASTTVNFSGIGSISVINSSSSTGEKSSSTIASILANLSVVNYGYKSINGVATTFANNSVTFTGSKTTFSSAVINANNIINVLSEKQGKNTAQLNINNTIANIGYKLSSNVASISVVNSFTVTGTAASIITKAGSGIISANSILNSIGAKETFSSATLNALANTLSTGIKSSKSVVTDAFFNTFSSAGFKASLSSTAFASNTTINSTGYSNAFNPIIRKVTIHGVISSTVINAKINNSISIKGVF